NNMAKVRAPVTTAQKIRNHGAPSESLMDGLDVRLAMTSEPESAEVTENSSPVTTASPMLNDWPGYSNNRLKNPDSGLLIAVLRNSSSPARKNARAPLPKIEIHRMM